MRGGWKDEREGEGKRRGRRGGEANTIQYHYGAMVIKDGHVIAGK